MLTRDGKTQALLELSHQLGREERGLVILGEGNTSARFTPETFIVKASGTSLATLRAEDVVECRFSQVLAALEQTDLTDADIEEVLLACRVYRAAPKPSVEAMFHAWLLNLPEVNFVGHTHGVATNSVLCSPRAQEFAQRRMFPDEVVCCGSVSVFIPYTDPGLPLAQAIRDHVTEYMRQHQQPPRVILLENHGVVALGRTSAAVEAATLMTEKAARIFLGAAALGGPRFFSAENVARISGRPDEKYRQKALQL